MERSQNPGRAALEFFRDGSWLTRERVYAYSRMAVFTYAAAAVMVVATSHGILDLGGRPLGTDFTAVWTAGSLALKGHAADAYDWSLHAVEELALAGDPRAGYFGWHYPPLFFLLAAPLATLPYLTALLLWMGITASAYVACIRRIVVYPAAGLVALAVPAAFVNLGHGQNGFFSAALLGSGLLSLQSSPLLAGVAFGVACYKPQVAVLLPLALIAGRHWRALAAMAATALALSAVTVFFFGTETWVAFIGSIEVTQHRILEQGASGFAKMVSVFAGARLLGCGVAVAWSAQWISSLAAAATVVWAWRSNGSAEAKAALLVCAVPLATPYVFDYDLVVLTVAGAFLVRDALKGGFRDWERTALAAGCVVPGAARGFATLTSIPLAPVVELLLVAVLIRRLRSA